MSLLSVVQGIARRTNYPQPSTVIGNTDPNVALMLDAVQDTGDELVERWGWQALKVQTPVYFTGDGATATFSIPATLETFQPSGTFVSSLYPTWRMPGPINEEDLLNLKNLAVSLYPSSWRVVGGTVEFYPVLQSGEIVKYVFAQNTWVTNSSGTPYSTPAPQADSDLFLVSERLLRFGGLWRFKMAKGLQYAEQMEDYEQAFQRQAGQESTTRVKDTSRTIVLNDADFFPGVITDLTDPSF